MNRGVDPIAARYDVGVESERCILHLDMDAFFASVEQLDDPALRGKPVLVGYDGPRGVVAAASYESREFGCHSAQPMAVAKRLCPQAIIVPVRGERYRELSRRMFGILDRFAPVVEPLSVDEAFLDVTGTERLQGSGEDVAAKLKKAIRDELSLTASVGVAPNKFLAKLASDLRKPDGLVVIRAGEAEAVLGPLAVTKLWGIGSATAGRLANLGVRTVADLRKTPIDRLAKHLGSDAERYVSLSYGRDDRPVTSDREANSISHEQTFGADLIDPAEVRRVLLDQVEQVGARLRRHSLKARGVSLKIRYGDFKTINRSATLEPTDATAELWKASLGLFDAWRFEPVRLIGMTAERLSAGEGQMSLFSDPKREKQQKLDAVADRINQKFGKRAIKRHG